MIKLTWVVIRLVAMRNCGGDGVQSGNLAVGQLKEGEGLGPAGRTGDDGGRIREIVEAEATALEDWLCVSTVQLLRGGMWLEVPRMAGWPAMLTECLPCLRMAPSCPHADMRVAGEQPRGVEADSWAGVQPALSTFSWRAACLFCGSFSIVSTAASSEVPEV